MSRFKKGMAALLSVAMIATSFQMPVFAEEFTDDSVSVEATESAEVTETETTEEPEVELGENLDTVYVYNASELVSALNGKSSSKEDQERIKRGNYRIKIGQYKELVTGKTSVNPWLLSGNEVVTLNKEIKEVDFENLPSQIEIDSSISENETKYFKLVIPKESEITLRNVYKGLPWMIENQGQLVLDSVNLCARYASAVTNQGFLEIKGSTISGNNTTSNGKNIITNTGSMIVYSGSEIYNSNDDDKVNAAIYSSGSVSINGGTIYNTTTSGNAIYISGNNAVATVRGTTIIRSNNGSAVVNRDGAKFIMNRAVEDGRQNINIYNASSTNPTVYTYNGATTEMYSGTIYNSYSDGQVVRTTPKSVSGNTDGKLIMSDGRIGYSSQYGIVYKENKPVLKYGMVVGSSAAVMKVSDNGAPDKVTTYQFENRDGVSVNAYEKKGEIYEALPSIIDGLYGLNGSSNNKYLDYKEVKTFDELKQALTTASVNGVKLSDDITISGNLTFNKDFTIQFNNHKLIASDMKDIITVDEGKKVNFIGKYLVDIYKPFLEGIQFDCVSSNRAALFNSGELYLENIYIEGNGTTDGYTLVQNAKKGSILQSITGRIYANSKSISKNGLTYGLKNYGTVSTEGRILNQTIGNYAVSIYNEGNYLQAGKRVYNSSNGGYDLYTGDVDADGFSSTALWNQSGTFEIENGNVWNNSSVSSNSAVYIVGGTVRLQGGRIGTDSYASSSHAIVYTDEKQLPVLIGGSVTGAAANKDDYTVSKNEPARGSAVVCLKGGKITTGSFVNGNGATVNGQDAIYIQDGKIKTEARAESNIYYLLMERDETINNIVEAMSKTENGLTIWQNHLANKDEYTLSSNNPSVVKVSENKLAISANGVGEARLTFQWKGSGVTDSVRIEVVEKGKRATISANDYNGSLINKVEYVNAYKTLHEVAMEWHLANSETSTGGVCDLERAQEIQPNHVIIEDETFKKYFEIDSYNNMTIFYDNKDKKYHFTIKPILENDSVKLIEDEVSSIDNIEVKIQVTNGNGVKSVKTIGSFNIVMQNKKPTMTFIKPITFNSAYQGSAHMDFNRTKVLSDLKTSAYIVRMAKLSCSEGINVSNFDEWDFQDAYIYYSGDGSIKKGNVHVEAEIDGYNGTYETDIPVTIAKSLPVVTPAEKSITIAEDVAEMTDIMVALEAKNEFSLSTIKNIEITDKNSKFNICGLSEPGVWENKIKKNFYGPYFYLQPKQNITKAQTVNMKVTYQGTVAVKGKEYSTNLKIKINPVKKKDFTMKLTTKNPTLLTKVSVNNASYQQYGKTLIQFTTTPTNYKGGYFTVSNLDGTEVNGVSISKVVSYSGGNCHFNVYANKDIVNQTKKLDLYVTRYGNDGKELGKKMKVTIKLIKDSSLKFTKKEVTMDVNTTESKDIDTTLRKMSVNVPIKTSGAGNWGFTAEGSALFEVYSTNAQNVWIKPVKEALCNGAIVPGGSYQLKLKGTNEIGEVVYQDITVKVKKGKVTNSICDISNNYSAINNFTLYKAAPVAQQTFTVITQNPFYGMFVKNVEIMDKNSPFELDHAYIKNLDSYYNYFYDDYYGYEYYHCKEHQHDANGEFRLCFKNGKVDPKIKKTNSVKIRITYENGQTVNRTIKVNVK
ncbi:MAG: hypothetical protein PHY47_23395 [Lachnospiraceae bacterium]|nr:hypothetical protein [Lachnospiraceae bacterium]